MDTLDKGPAPPSALLPPALKVGLFTGTGGLIVGATGGVIRSKHPVLFSLFSGLQWFTLGSSFWLTRSFLLQEVQQDPTKKPFASSVAGGLSAGFTAAAFRGRSNILPGVIIGGAAGFLGQHASDTWGPTPDVESVPKMPLLERMMRSKWSPLEPLTPQDYDDMINKKILRVDAELSIIEEDMAKLQSTNANRSADGKA